MSPQFRLMGFLKFPGDLTQTWVTWQLRGPPTCDRFHRLSPGPLDCKATGEVTANMPLYDIRSSAVPIGMFSLCLNTEEPLMSLSSDSEPSEEWWLLRGGHGPLDTRGPSTSCVKVTVDPISGHSGSLTGCHGQGVSGERCCLQQGCKVRNTLNQSII